jgi:beta-glucanase (GH16 family)
MKKLFALVAMFAVFLTPAIRDVAVAETTSYASPAITESAKVGQTVRLTLATWPDATSQSYVWLLAGKPIASAKSLTLKVVATMNAKTIQAKQTATVAGQTVTRTSNALVVGKTTISASTAIAFADASKTSIQVSGLKVSPNTKTIKYQWFKDGSAIKGATTSRYKFVASASMSEFKVSITAQAVGFASNKFTTQGFVPDDQPKQYTLMWSDEFNGAAGSAVDSTKWDFQEGDGVAFKNAGWGNNEEQWYLKKQATVVGDGNLAIDASRNGAGQYKCYYGTCKWVSSKLVTYKKVGFLYGRFEARVKGSLGQGVWPAFWLLGANIADRPWPGCGEIDIMELKGQNPDTVWGTVHGPNGSIGTTTTLDTDLTGWHTYAIDWTPTSITWYVDGVQYHKVTKTEYVGSSAPAVWVFDHEFYIILNLAMGGNFVGGPTDETVDSANLTFDYVRYYTVDGVGQVINH